MKRQIMLISTILLLSIILITGCGIKKNLEDITENANKIIEDADELLVIITDLIDSGQLDKRVGNLIKEQITHSLEEINKAIKDSGGYIFDELNGVIDNSFSQISDLLDQIRQAISSDDTPLLEDLSYRLEYQTNVVADRLEDLVEKTFTGSFMLVDKMVKGIVIIISIILLGIGLIIFVRILSRQQGPIEGTKWIGMILAGIYILLFLAIIFVNPVRDFIMSELGLVKKWKINVQKPKITGIYPEKIVLGTDYRLTILGKNLDQVRLLRISLYQNDDQMFTFPEKVNIAKSDNKIILSDFDKALNWSIPNYSYFIHEVIPSGSSISMRAQYAKIADTRSKLLYPGSIKGKVEFANKNLKPNVTTPSKRLYSGYQKKGTSSKQDKTTPQKSFANAAEKQIKLNVEKAFLKRFKLAEGTYNLRVYAGDSLVSSPQILTVDYPPPPEKPDIVPIALSWTGNIVPVKGDKARLTVHLGFKHPEQIKKAFEIQIINIPSLISPNSITVNTELVNKLGNNLLRLNTDEFELPQSGDYRFEVIVDKDGDVVDESDRTNNSQIYSLKVKQYVYDATLRFTSFKSEVDLDPKNDDEYRINVNVRITGTDEKSWNFTFSKNGEASDIFDLDYIKTFEKLKEDTYISIAITGKEIDSDWDWLKIINDDDYMGSLYHTITIPPSVEETQFKMENQEGKNQYIITGDLVVNRRAL